jgi:hypothetical protein
MKAINKLDAFKDNKISDSAHRRFLKKIMPLCKEAASARNRFLKANSNANPIGIEMARYVAHALMTKHSESSFFNFFQIKGPALEAEKASAKCDDEKLIHDIVSEMVSLGDDDAMIDPDFLTDREIAVMDSKKIEDMQELADAMRVSYSTPSEADEVDDSEEDSHDSVSEDGDSPPASRVATSSNAKASKFIGYLYIL